LKEEKKRKELKRKGRTQGKAKEPNQRKAFNNPQGRAFLWPFQMEYGIKLRN